LGLKVKALTILESITDFALSTIFSTVGNTTNSVGETDLTIKEEFFIASRTHTVCVFRALSISLLTLEKLVKEVFRAALKTFSRI
jgi:hypothetical protein